MIKSLNINSAANVFWSEKPNRVLTHNGFKVDNSQSDINEACSRPGCVNL